MTTNILFIDTETTGLYKHSAPVDDPKQPYVVQLGLMLTQRNSKKFYGFQPLQSFGAIIRVPVGTTINPFALEVHGISVELCNEYGIPGHVATSVLDDLLHEADLLVAHNVQFDKAVINTFLTRHNIDTKFFDQLPTYCTMKESTEFCGLTTKNGRPKWPKLTELHQVLFEEGFAGTHDALDDVNATARCYYELTK